jgi:hypothetical protein
MRNGLGTRLGVADVGVPRLVLITGNTKAEAFKALRDRPCRPAFDGPQDGMALAARHGAPNSKSDSDSRGRVPGPPGHWHQLSGTVTEAGESTPVPDGKSDDPGQGRGLPLAWRSPRSAPFIRRGSRRG